MMITTTLVILEMTRLKQIVDALLMVMKDEGGERGEWKTYEGRTCIGDLLVTAKDGHEPRDTLSVFENRRFAGVRNRGTNSVSSVGYLSGSRELTNSEWKWTQTGSRGVGVTRT